MTDLRLWLRLPLMVLMLAVGGAIAACEEEGPAQKAGAEIDKATEDVKDAAEDAAEKVKEATE